MEAAAKQDAQAICPSAVGGPKSCREKFLKAWTEKVKLQPSPILSPQVPDCQSAIGVPAQGKQVKEQAVSQLIQKASLQPSDNAVCFLTLVPSFQEQLHSSPVSLSATGHRPTTALCERLRDLFNREMECSLLNLETNAKEELLHICASDLLLECPTKKRPRLLPPNRKMHVVVRKKQASHPVQEGGRNPIPLQYSHPVDTVAMTSRADLPTVESFYRGFTPRLGENGSSWHVRPGQLLAEYSAPTWSTKAATYQAVTTDKMSQKQLPHQLSVKKSAPVSDLMVDTKWSTNASQGGHLPPKKRYTRGYR